MAQYYKKKYS